MASLVLLFAAAAVPAQQASSPDRNEIRALIARGACLLSSHSQVCAKANRTRNAARIGRCDCRCSKPLQTVIRPHHASGRIIGNTLPPCQGHLCQAP